MCRVQGDALGDIPLALSAFQQALARVSGRWQAKPRSHMARNAAEVLREGICGASVSWGTEKQSDDLAGWDL